MKPYYYKKVLRVYSDGSFGYREGWEEEGEVPLFDSGGLREVEFPRSAPAHDPNRVLGMLSPCHPQGGFDKEAKAYAELKRLCPEW